MGTLLAPQVAGGCWAVSDVLVLEATCKRRGATVIAFVDVIAMVDVNRDAAFREGAVAELDCII